VETIYITKTDNEKSISTTTAKILDFTERIEEIESLVKFQSR